MSEHFSLAELGAAHAPAAVVERLQALMLLLEEIRAILGVPIQITSGWRSWERNAEIGGSPTSQHPAGEAADCVPIDVTAGDAWRLLRTHRPKVGQCILYGVADPELDEGTFFHVSMPNVERGIVDDWMWTPSRGGAGGPYFKMEDK